MRTLARLAAATLLFAFAIIAAELAYRASAAQDGPPLRPAESRSTPAEAEATPPARSEPREDAYAGNTKSRKFHRKGCRYFNCTNCTAKFSRRQDAINAGYSPCGTCNP